MKHKKLIITIALVIIAGTGLFFLFSKGKPEYVEDVSREELLAAYELLSNSLTSGKEVAYTDFMYLTDSKPGKGESTAVPRLGQNAVLDYDEEISYEVTVESEGFYNFELSYKPDPDTYTEYTVSVLVNGENQYTETKTVVLPIRWESETKIYTTDRYGDEIAPKQVKKAGEYTVALKNNTASTVDALPFILKKGKNIITVKNVSNNGLTVGTLKVKAAGKELPSYSDYIKLYENENKDVEAFTVNAIDYDYKNSLEIICEASSNPALEPFDTEYKKLNILSWTADGAEITYDLEAPETGLYKLALHYSNGKEETNAFLSLKIDGTVPFEELQAYAFPYTGGSWANRTVADENGNPYLIFLTKGNHKLTITTEGAGTAEAIRYGRLIAAHATDFALAIRKISGEKPDKYRTWKMTQFIPEISDYLEAYRTLLTHIRYELQFDSDNGVNSALLSYLDKADNFIDEMAEYPDEIALYVDDLTGRDNSIIVAVSSFTSAMMKESLSLDRIYFYGNGKIPGANANVFKAIGANIASVYHTFTSEKYKVTDKETDTLTVWVNRALTHVDLLQKMVDTDFTPKTGIKVKISVMPDAGKLTLASAADNTPDVALGLVSYMPFDLACRDALYDLSSFPDFWQVANRFAPGTMVPYVYNEGVYAIPETMDFACTVYRKDIFENLDLEVPGTWDELVYMLPKLQRYGMNFYHNISSGVGYKWFYQTTPLIFQNGGSLYNESGTGTAIDSVNSVKGLKKLGELFVAYSLETTVNEFFNSFRYATLPVGICDSGTYILIKNGAPELEGQWALAPYLGTVREDGSVSRWFVANGSGAIIFKDAKNPQEAWEFMKWWTEYETQVEYTYTLRSTYGENFFWLPSNLAALAQAPIDEEDKRVILSMAEWLRDVPRTPGQYLLERSISDIWNAMVLDGASAQVAADERVIDINREIKKKMKELGYYDEDGNMLKSYVIRDIDWIKEHMEQGKEE